MAKASAIWIEANTPAQMGLDLRMPNSPQLRRISSLSGHIIDSDKLAIYPMSARPKHTGRTVRCARRKQI